MDEHYRNVFIVFCSLHHRIFTAHKAKTHNVQSIYGKVASLLRSLYHISTNNSHSHQGWRHRKDRIPPKIYSKQFTLSLIVDVTRTVISGKGIGHHIRVSISPLMAAINFPLKFSPNAPSRLYMISMIKSTFATQSLVTIFCCCQSCVLFQVSES